MTLLPIVERELRVASRRSRTYSARLVHAGAALFAVFAVTFILTRLQTMPAHALGTALFQAVVWLNFFLCLVMGIHLTSDCISEERREGTLGFLFLTDLKGYDVILGKLAATSMAAGYAVMAGVPVMGIPLLLGGVTALDFGRAVLLLFCTLLLSLTAGMFISSFNSDARRAAGWTFILLLLYCLVGPIAGIACMEEGTLTGREIGEVLLSTSPLCACGIIFEKSAPQWMFWMSLAFAFGSSGILLVLAARRVRHSWQDKTTVKGAARKVTPSGTPPEDSAVRREQQDQIKRNRTFRKQLLDINAVFWLASRGQFKVHCIRAFLALAALFWLWGLATVGSRDWLSIGFVAYFCHVIHLVLKLGVTAEAGERFGLDMQSGALELLLSTRLEVEDILRGQLLALRRHFLRPAVLIFAADLVLLGLVFRYSWAGMREQYEMLYALVASMILFIADTWALCWVGMWTGLNGRDMKKASMAAVGRVLIAPWLIVVIVSGLWEAARSMWVLGWEEITFMEKVTAWLALSLLNDWLAGRSARRRLQTGFRLTAMQRFNPPESVPIWKKIWRWCAGEMSISPAPAAETKAR